MKLRYLLVVSVIALSSCSAPPPPSPATSSEPPPLAGEPVPPRAPALPKGDWTDWPLRAGDWVYRRDERGSIALFGPVGQNATLTLRCDRARGRIYLAREGAGSAARMIVRTSSALKEFASSPTGGTPAYLATEIIPADPILDAMALSRGRIAIETSGHTPIAIPSWAEITRIVEDCRG
jgi:hypothetical protein